MLYCEDCIGNKINLKFEIEIYTSSIGKCYN